MNLKEIIEKIDNKEVDTLGQLSSWIKHSSQYLPVPSKLKKGDVFVYGINGMKSRPHVIYKIIDNLVISIPLTKTNDEMSINQYNSRFFGNGYFAKSIIFVKVEHVESKLVGVLEDNNSLNTAFNEIMKLL